MLLPFAAKKMITSFLVFPGVVILFLFVMTLIFFLFRKKWGGILWRFSLTLALGLWFFSLQPFNYFILRHLEYGEYDFAGRLAMPINSQSLANNLKEASEKAQVIVVLGGGSYYGLPGLMSKRILDKLDSLDKLAPGALVTSYELMDRPSEDTLYRLVEAYRLWEYIKKDKNKELPLIISGGDTSGTGNSEAKVAKAYLASLGVAEELIITEDKSFDTYENYLNVKQLMLENAWKQMILVTSAFHMKRSLMLFASEEALSSFSVFPYPVAFITSPWEEERDIGAASGPAGLSILRWVPWDFSYLRLSFKELLGMLAYARRGY